MKELKINWMVIFWVSIIILFLWLLAKTLGFINTPLIIELIPYITAFTAILAIAKEIGAFINKMYKAISDIGEMKNEIKDIKIDIKDIRSELHSLDKRLTIIENKV